MKTEILTGRKYDGDLDLLLFLFSDLKSRGIETPAGLLAAGFLPVEKINEFRVGRAKPGDVCKKQIKMQIDANTTITIETVSRFGKPVLDAEERNSGPTPGGVDWDCDIVESVSTIQGYRVAWDGAFGRPLWTLYNLIEQAAVLNRSNCGRDANENVKH